MTKANTLETTPANSNMLIAALSYCASGWSVIPVEPRGKRPLVRWAEFQSRRATPDEIKAWWNKFPAANIGIVTGEVSGGLIVVDSDSKDFYPELVSHGVVTTDRGRHYYHPYDPPCQKAVAWSESEVRGDGCFVVAPPSIHQSGRVYSWGGHHEEGTVRRQG